jgi:predicted nucleotidyltransferase
MLLEKREGNMRYVKANIENQFLKHLKIAFSIKKIMDSGIVSYLNENIPVVSSIILFGSIAKGEDDEKSDIDLLVIGQKKIVDLSKFEEKLGKDINLTCMKWSEWRKHAEEDKAFYREIITDGIVLYGSMPVIE